MDARSNASTDTSNRLVIILQLVFLLGLGGYYIFQGIFPSIEMILATLAILLLWKTQSRKLFRDLIPFLVLLLTFQSLRSFADNLAISDIHILDLIAYEKNLFNGIIPANYLQGLLMNNLCSAIIVFIANILYMSHFLNPVLFAILLWYKSHQFYWYFIGGLVFLTYAGFFTFIVFPAAPPWWATKYGYLTDQIVVLSRFYYPTLVEFAGPNPVAAMPSLHMAYPTFISIYSIFIWAKKGIPTIMLPISIGLSTLILGHHYVIDLIAGVIYAVITFLVLLLIKKWLNVRSQIKKD
jgi:membrane-associated phospholipid phosphatase